MAAMLDRSGEFRDLDLLRRNFLALNEQRNASCWTFCDIVLKVCNTEIFAHANVLAAASPYFSSFLGTGNDCPRTFCQKQPQTIEIHIDSVLLTDGDGGYGEAVSKVVNYMYTSEITLTTTLVSQIIEIGKIMLLDKLLEFCLEFQKGIDDNVPRSVSTSTSGLQEVVNLLGARSKIVKRVDAATETDESLFAKLRCVTPVSLLVHETTTTLSESPLKSCETNAPYDNLNVTSTVLDIIPEKLLIPDNIAPIEEAQEEELPSCRKSEQEAPSLFDDTFEQSSITPSELPRDVPIPSQSESSLGDPHCLIRSEETLQTSKTHIDSTVESLEHFSTAMESFVEILNAPLPKDFPATSETNEKNEVRQTDVFTSHDVPTTSKKAENVSDKMLSTDSLSHTTLVVPRRRGRPRGRGRGRGRRGRPPGRPRKVKDLESDPEFDEFITQLEKGNGDVIVANEKERSNVAPDESAGEEDMDCSSVVISDLPSKNEDPDYNAPVNIKRDLPSSFTHGMSTMWKSPRIRSKPSQLKKDYIFHSLSRKTRKAQGVSSHERNPVQISKRSASASSLGGTSSVGRIANSLQFVCQNCEFSTSIFKDYKRHLRSHPETDPRYFVCQKCDFKTTKSREYTAHKQMHMVMEFTCIYCDYQAGNSTDYEEHMGRHSGEYPYFCTECSSRFKKKIQLMSHNRKHQLEKPFVCPVCSAGFKWKHALKSHMITHSRTKDLLCDVCGYTTAHKSQMKAHRLIHSGQTFKCSIPGCHYEATKRQKLKYHMVTHTHEKPHQCDVCGQRFSLNKNMRRHMLLHTNTRPYACKMCSFTTTRYDKLKEHNFKLHNIGEASVPKKAPVDYLTPNVTYVKSDSITLNPDGTFSQEALQTIAQLATSQQATDLGTTATTIKVEQTPSDDANYPIIASIHYALKVDQVALQFIEDMPE